MADDNVQIENQPPGATEQSPSKRAAEASVGDGQPAADGNGDGGKEKGLFAGNRKRIVLIVGAVLLVAAVVYGFMPDPIMVELAEATRGPLEVTVDEEGRTRVQDRYVVSAPVAGYARRLPWEVGDAVAQGDVLLTLEPTRAPSLDARSRAQAQAQVAAAQARLNAAEEEAQAAEAAADLAVRELDRMTMLYESGNASQQALDQAIATRQQAQARLRSATFAVDVARYDVDAAQTALRYAGREAQAADLVEVQAPVDGAILAVHQKSEGVVQPGQPLVAVGDPRALEVMVEVLSTDAVQIGPGTRVRFERWGGEQPLDGRVRVVEPVGFTKVSALGVEEQRVRIIADLTSPPAQWERLGDGYRVEAQFIVWEGADVLRVPSSALFREGEGWAVFVAQDDEAELRRVEIGHRAGLQTEIVSGLEAGEQVIPHPDDDLEDGASIEPRS